MSQEKHTWHIVLKAELTADLALLDQLLWQEKIPHRFTEEQGYQCLWVPDHIPLEAVEQLVSQWREAPEKVVAADPNSLSNISVQAIKESLWRNVWLNPVTIILLLLSMAGAALVTFNHDFSLVKWFTFVKIEPTGNGQAIIYTLQATLEQGQWWRLVTPIFLHFGALHIVFNSLWLWDLGRRIERVQSRKSLLLLTLIIGVFSNWGQYTIEESVMFGGMSGVIYGLLGYIWLMTRFFPDPRLNFPRSLWVMMLGFLLLGYSGILDAAIGGSIANTAHSAGLIAGLIMAAGLIAYKKIFHR